MTRGQRRGRILVEGGGSTAAVQIAVGSTTVPVDDAAWYSASGGTVVAGPQRITYTSKVSGGQGALIGTALTPTNAPTLANAGGGVGLSSGVYQYAVTFVTGSGETIPGPTASITVDTTAAAAPTTIGTASANWVARGSAAPEMDYDANYSYKYTFYDAPSGGETTPSPASNTFNSEGWGDAKLTKSGVQAPPAGATRRFYRTDGGGSTYKRLTGATEGFASNDALYYYDSEPDSTLGATPPTSNTLTRERVALSNIAIGPAGVTSRKVYRTTAGGSQLKLVTTIANNTATTYTDSTADASLGANAPTTDTSGLVASGEVLAGSTTIPVTSGTPFESAGGWAVVGGTLVQYTGKTSTSLTGVPASGLGALNVTVRYGAELVAAPMLTGIPASGAGSILYPIAQGEPVNILVQRDDAAAQAAMAGFVGGDGIVEEYIQDNRLSITEAQNRGDAQLALVKDPLVTITYQTRDPTTRSGREVTFNLGPPTNINGTYKIQSVTISGFDPLGRTFPLRQVEASSRRFSFEQILRLLKGV